MSYFPLLFFFLYLLEMYNRHSTTVPLIAVTQSYMYGHTYLPILVKQPLKSFPAPVLIGSQHNWTYSLSTHHVRRVESPSYESRPLMSPTYFNCELGGVLMD